MRLHLNNQLSMSKSNFLFSTDNKQNFCLMLDDKLTKTGITVNYDSGDADLLIVQTALKAGKDYPTVLTGEDTDLLLLALHHFTNEKARMYYSLYHIGLKYTSICTGCKDILFQKCFLTNLDVEV